MLQSRKRDTLVVMDQGNDQSRHMKKQQELGQEHCYENDLCKESQRAWVRGGASKG